MPREKSAGAVIFRREHGKVFYLLLHYHFKGDYWDFPRGNVEKGETDQQSALREVKEETGLTNIKFVEGFKESVNWFYHLKGQNIFKVAVYFLAETKEKKVKLSKEHLEFKWLEFEEALRTLTYDNAKQILKKANSFLGKGLKKFLK